MDKSKCGKCESWKIIPLCLKREGVLRGKCKERDIGTTVFSESCDKFKEKRK